MSDVKSPAAVESSADTLAPTTVHNQKAGFWTRRKKILCGAGVATFIALFLIIFLPILFFVIGPKVAQKSINSSVLTFREAKIFNPSNTTFDLDMIVDVTEAGHNDATLTHEGPMTVAWITPTGKEIPILSVVLPPFSVDGGKGVINAKVKGVTILSQEALLQFNRFLIGGPEFQWRLTASMSVHALGRDYDGLTLDKTVTLKGMNGLQGTTIKEFALPGYPATQDLPSIPFVGNATLINPSPVGLELDITSFDVATSTGVPLGKVTSKKTFINAAGNSTLLTEGALGAIANLPIQVAALLPAVLQGKLNIPIVITPTSVGGDNPISWISGALVGAKLNATMGYASEKPAAPAA
ncbi:hypothetical protein HDU86_001903 [Geranomyces michiganensis]|nr:hypothetical protein HDU86_001903 [Geranomyces michiganensis]